jgi:serine/threonine protein phosphatase PrpC
MYRFDIHGAQIQGGKPRQEDRFAIRQFGNAWLTVLADGMGGYSCGAEAAQIAIDVTLKYAQVLLDKDVQPNPASVLEFCASWSHQQVCDYGSRTNGCLGMGSTYIAACVAADSDRLHYAYLGDSLLLRLTPQRIEDICDPQGDGPTLVAGLGVSVDALKCPPNGIPIRGGDRILLASDGLDTLLYPIIAGILESAPDAKAAVERLLAAVERARLPHQDNTTIIALFVGEETP